MGTRREWRAHGTARIEFVPDSDDGQCVCAGGFSLWPVHARMHAKGARARSELGAHCLTSPLPCGRRWVRRGHHLRPINGRRRPGTPIATYTDRHMMALHHLHAGGHCTNPLKVRASRPQVSKSLRSVRVGNYSGPEGRPHPRPMGSMCEADTAIHSSVHTGTGRYVTVDYCRNYSVIARPAADRYGSVASVTANRI
ncbi:hypothetical protein BJV77DRAFT_741954 [Russula vinacea]|nr:hypothetical protein BJV77DRAFT_741954 [Russula vinacea]